MSDYYSALRTKTAVVLRDKAIAEMKDQITVLENHARISMAVEVTGQQRQPIYARGHFDHDGSYSEWRPSLWRVNLATAEQPCRLSDLRNIEVWIGGSKKSGAPNGFLLQHNSQAFLVIGFSICRCFLWVGLQTNRFEELDAQNIVDRSTRRGPTILDSICETHPQVVCDIIYLYQVAADYLPLVQSVPGSAANRDVSARNRNAVRAALRELDHHFRRERPSNSRNLFRPIRHSDLPIMHLDREGFHVAPIMDRLMIAIEQNGVDVQDQQALRAFLVDYGAERIFGDIYV